MRLVLLTVSTLDLTWLYTESSRIYSKLHCMMGPKPRKMRMHVDGTYFKSSSWDANTLRTSVAFCYKITNNNSRPLLPPHRSVLVFSIHTLLYAKTNCQLQHNIELGTRGIGITGNDGGYWRHLSRHI
jgi:hypothetical protein